MNEVSIEYFTDNYYKEYSMYVLEQRAIPSYIDGFKPVQRKLIYASLKLPKDKEVKVSELGASIASCDYHHGEVSSSNALILMAAPYNNNVPLYEIEGSFGTRSSQEAASPRYIFVTLSEQFKNIFIDEEVCDQKGEYEPLTYLPIIPFSLVNGITGIAVGFATNILPRDVNDIKKVCIEYLTKGKIKTEMKVQYPFFVGEIEKLEDKKWCTKGIIDRKVKGKKVIYHITELPVGYDRAKYFIKLSDLIEKKLILDFEENVGTGTSFDFTIYANEEQAIQIDKDVMKFFGLIKYETENLTTLDEYGKLRIFKSPEELVAAFCDYRLKKTQDYINYKIEEYIKKLSVLLLKIAYINDVIDGVINFKNINKAELLTFLVDKKIADKDVCESALSMPSYSFTVDNVIKLQNDINSVNTQLESFKSLDAKELFIERLKQLKI